MGNGDFGAFPYVRRAFRSVVSGRRGVRGGGRWARVRCRLVEGRSFRGRGPQCCTASFPRVVRGVPRRGEGLCPGCRLRRGKDARGASTSSSTAGNFGDSKDSRRRPMALGVLRGAAASTVRLVAGNELSIRIAYPGYNDRHYFIGQDGKCFRY